MQTDSWLAIARGATVAATRAAVTPLARSVAFTLLERIDLIRRQKANMPVSLI